MSSSSKEPSGRVSTIPPVSVGDLTAAVSAGGVDAGTRQLVEAELDYVRAWRERHRRPPPTDQNLTALCISGGGIRSATFATGILQALAHADLLKRFDYLSTVSGGGYIGSSLTWLLSEQVRKTLPKGSAFGIGPDDFPYGTESPDPHAHASGHREDPPLQRKVLQYLRTHGKYLTPGNGIGIFSLLGIVLRGMLLNLLVWIPIAALVFAGLLAVNPQTYVAFLWIQYGAAAAMVLLGVGSVIYSLATVLGRTKNEHGRYNERRWFDQFAGFIILMAIALQGLGLVPWVHFHLERWGAATLAEPAAAVAGALSGIWAFLTSRKKESKVPVSLVASGGAFLFIYGLLLVTYGLGANILAINPNEMRALWYAPWWVPFLVAIVTGRFVNLNYISVHRFYRDRLMETFMPAISVVAADATGPSREADGARTSEVLTPETPTSPYHVVNTNVILVRDRSRTRRTRGGDSFILAPQYSGSNATGWRRTVEFEHNGMTLATAMAISGAAAQPNAGVGGVGLTRSITVSLLMTLLNLRLGYWVHNPMRKRQSGPAPNHFNPGFMALTDAGFTADAKFLELSDGGHFENLAMYEMIRRRVRRLVVLDGGADPDFNFSDLQNAMTRVESDFGASITFEANEKPSRLIPRKKPPDRYPKKVRLAERGYVQGTITYADGSEGILIYVKTTLIEDLDLTVLGYKDGHREFPDESTADQFFDERQVDAYRLLGYRIGMQMIDGVGQEALGTV